MARTTKQESARLEAALLAAARKAFAAHGVQAVALEDIAQAAGVTRGAVYHRWPNKQALVAAVLEPVMTEVARSVDRAAAKGTDDWDSLERGCIEFVRAATRPAVRRLMLVDGPTALGWPAWRELDAKTSRRGLEETFAALAAAGELSVPPTAAALLVSGALNEAALWVGETDDPDAALADVTTVVDALLAGLRAK